MAKQETKNKQIITIEQLKELAKAEGGMDCYILLNGGLRSSRHIKYCPDDNSFLVLNLSDESEEELTESQILDSECSNIGKAMEKGCLIKD